MNRATTFVGAPSANGTEPQRTCVVVVRRALGAMWLLDGALQLQPHMFTSSFVTAVLDPSSQGQAGWISWLVGANAHLIGSNVAGWDAVFACVQLLIGAGLMMRSTTKPALVVSFFWSLGVWGLGEGFGMLFTGKASPLTGAPGAVLLYGLIGLMVWPAGRDAGDEAARSGSVASHGLLGDVGARVIWASLWVLFAVLWLLPANTSSGAIGRQISAAAGGEPTWLSGLLGSAGHLLGSSGLADSVALAAASLVIGVGALVSRSPTAYLAAGASMSLVFWVFGQAFGTLLTGPLSGTATDANSGPLLVLMAAALVPLTLREAPRSVRTSQPSTWAAKTYQPSSACFTVSE